MVDGASLADEVGSTTWYHTLELPGGVVTDGYFDLRGLPKKVLPDDLTGKRCLDACTSSGFWAFEMEKRNAKEVVAIDIEDYRDKDWQIESAAPAMTEIQRDSFSIAKRALGAQVQKRDLSVYDVSPEQIAEFDFVFIGAVLIHLRDPVRALRALRTVLRPGGELRSLDVILLMSSVLHPRTPRGQLYSGDDTRWWTPNAAAHRRWLVAAGFDVSERPRLVFERFGPLVDKESARAPSLRARLAVSAYRRIGVPCQLLVCR